jgi:hypothetical protein
MIAWEWLIPAFFIEKITDAYHFWQFRSFVQLQGRGLVEGVILDESLCNYS